MRISVNVSSGCYSLVGSELEPLLHTSKKMEGARSPCKHKSVSDSCLGLAGGWKGTFAFTAELCLRQASST